MPSLGYIKSIKIYGSCLQNNVVEILICLFQCDTTQNTRWGACTCPTQHALKLHLPLSLSFLIFKPPPSNSHFFLLPQFVFTVLWFLVCSLSANWSLWKLLERLFFLCPLNSCSANWPPLICGSTHAKSMSTPSSGNGRQDCWRFGKCSTMLRTSRSLSSTWKHGSHISGIWLMMWRTSWTSLATKWWEESWWRRVMRPAQARYAN